MNPDRRTCFHLCLSVSRSMQNFLRRDESAQLVAQAFLPAAPRFVSAVFALWQKRLSTRMSRRQAGMPAPRRTRMYADPIATRFAAHRALFICGPFLFLT